jgi:hypothetical protein
LFSFSSNFPVLTNKNKVLKFEPFEENIENIDNDFDKQNYDCRKEESVSDKYSCD